MGLSKLRKPVAMRSIHLILTMRGVKELLFHSQNALVTAETISATQLYI